jgi:drug/metabolite transporter (DMT)-like permease
MKNNKITLGFVLAAVSTILCVVGHGLYKSALMQDSLTNTLLICAAVAGAAALVLAFVLGKEIPNICLIAHAVLIMAAIGISAAPMVNEFGLVYAGLNPKTNLSGYITFAVCACIAWVISIVATFMGVTKKEA